MSNRAYKSYKFESTGETVIVPPISTINLQRKINKQNPSPRPPLVEVDYGDGSIKEENKHDPEYRQSLIDHQNKIGLMVMNSALYRVAIKQVLTDENKLEIELLKEELNGIEEFDENDSVAWFFEVACGNDAEVQELLEVATGMSDPTRKGVDAEVSNFRSPV